MRRTWFYNKLTTNAPLMAIVPGGLYQATKITRTPDVKPFMIYRVSAHVPSLRGDGRDYGITEVFQVFVHDHEGDYLRIETILQLLHTMIQSFSGDTQVISMTWLENSEDFRDEAMGTIFRYSRIQLNYRAA